VEGRKEGGEGTKEGYEGRNSHATSIHYNVNYYPITQSLPANNCLPQFARRWEFLVAGDAIKLMGDAEGEAKRGEVLGISLLTE
jgi:hypothetical protein